MTDERLKDVLSLLQAIAWEAVVVDDADLVLTHINDGGAGLVALPRDGQSSFTTLLHEADRADVVARCCALSPSSPKAALEFRLNGADGKIRWYAGDVHLLSDAAPRRIRGVVSNVTEQRHAVEVDAAARRELEEQLRQSQKMEAVGRLAAGVAHDFNNLLLLVSGHAEVLMAEVPAGSRLYKAAESVQKATDRATLLTQQLLAFSKRQVLKPRVVDLNNLIGGMSSLLQTLLHEDIELVVQRSAEMRLVRADPTQIERVILNLAANARDAMPKGGTLRLAVDGVTLDRAHGRRAGDLKPGRYVRLVVSDTGGGMDTETQNRIFEPFFTTKPRGTGLGLASVYGIVAQSGGHISVASEVGKGSTFTVLLPQVDEPPAVEPPPAERLQAAPAKSAGHEVVLLVEDEDAVRSLLRESLESYGYTVVEARSGAEAMNAASWQATLDLLVTDLIMPHMNGRELVERLRADRPRLKVLYITGYNDRDVAMAAEGEPHVDLLRKPFTGREFVRRVREMLDRK
jgi:two-component system cell cycle sensor histidine kinase/response regulator CckA